MKVAYLFSRYPVPSQTFCDTEMRALENAGFEIEIFSCSPPTTSFRHGADDAPRAPVFYAPPPDGLAWWEAAARGAGHWPGATVARHEETYGPRYDPAKRARHAVYFADLLRRRGIEHLHVHFANRATHAALFIHELTGIPFSFTAHAQDFLVDLGNDALLAEMCARASFVVAVSEWSRRALREKCPAATEKIYRVYNGLPLERWPAPTPAASMPADHPLNIFSVGRLIDFKGFSDLIAACGLLQDRGIPLQCEIAGEGPLHEALQQQIRFLDEPATVRLTGLLSQAQIRVRLAACDVFALPCRVDSKGASDVLPTVILEAMATGRPVVSTHLAAVPEMVEDRRTGLLVAPRNPVAFADALAHLAQRPDLRVSYGAAGREKLVFSFTAKDAARQLGALFKTGKVSRTATSGHTSARPDELPIACLLDRWPLPDLIGSGDPQSANLPHLHRGSASPRFLALKPGGPPPTSSDPRVEVAANLALLPMVEFLPDAFVLESCWRSHPDWVHRIEPWRSELGSGCDTEDFLLAARRALYLKFRFAEGPRPRHLHAIGPRSTLCAWLLKRLAAADTASFFLTSTISPASSDTTKLGLSGAMLRKLAPDFVGGWVVGERKLAATLGVNYRSEEPVAGVWEQCLQDWANGSAALWPGAQRRS